jgi:hypothetical protein
MLYGAKKYESSTEIKGEGGELFKKFSLVYEQLI